MKRRHLTFFFLSYLVVLGTLYIMNKTAPPPPPREIVESQLGERTTDTQTVRGPDDRPTSVTLARAEDDAATAAEIDEPAQEVAFKTESVDLVFTSRGGLPVRWDIVDTQYMTSVLDEKGRQTDVFIPESLIDPKIFESEGLPRPFELILKERNGSFLNAVNNAAYDYEVLPQNASGERGGVRFTSKGAPGGLRVEKTYLYDQVGFTGRFELKLTNDSGYDLRFDATSNEPGPAGLGIVLGPGVGHPVEDEGFMMNLQKVDAMVSAGGRSYDEMLKDLGQTATLGAGQIEWGAVQNLYFMMALVGDTPFTKARMQLDRDVAQLTREPKNVDKFPALELYTPPFDLAAGESTTFAYEFYAGPKKIEYLKEAGHQLDSAIFHDSMFDWFRWLKLLLLRMMTYFQGWVGNWGVAIILLTVTVRLVTFPLVHKGMKAQAKSAAEMKKIKPLIDQLNEKHKDAAKRQQEMMKLYREHGINPLGMFKGCFWLMIQMPILIALYRVLYTSIDIRGADFLWVQDLSQADRLFMLPAALPLIGGSAFNLLPILVAVTQFLTTKFMSQTQMATDPQQVQMQKMMMYMMPVMMLIFTYSLPSGLMVYWLVSNLWQVVQQFYVNKVVLQPAQEAHETAAPVAAAPAARPGARNARRGGRERRTRT